MVRVVERYIISQWILRLIAAGCEPTSIRFAAGSVYRRPAEEPYHPYTGSLPVAFGSVYPDSVPFTRQPAGTVYRQPAFYRQPTHITIAEEPRIPQTNVLGNSRSLQEPRIGDY